MSKKYNKLASKKLNCAKLLLSIIEHEDYGEIRCVQKDSRRGLPLACPWWLNVIPGRIGSCISFTVSAQQITAAETTLSADFETNLSCYCVSWSITLQGKVYRARIFKCLWGSELIPSNEFRQPM
jgi:hypothetical protein